MDKFLRLKIKTKLTFGIGLLFTMIVLLGGLAVRNITDMSSDTQNILADNYNYIMEYLLFSGKKIDEILFGCDCSNDGCHPADAAQLLIYRNLLKTLGLSPKIDGAVWR